MSVGDNICEVCGVARGGSGKIIVPETVDYTSAIYPYQTSHYTVVAVREGGFSGESQQNVEEVILPESIVKIGSGAFDGCGALKTVNIPSKITELNNIFNNCPSLSTITIPATVSQITSVFNNSTIDELIISDSETSLSAGGWFADYALIKKVYQGRNTNIRFESKEVESLTIGDCVTEISDAMYINTPLQEVIFGKSLTKIGSGAFKGTKLKEINLPESLTELGNNSFDYCALLESFNIPSKITELGYNFNNCPSIRKITIPSTVLSLTAVFGDCGTIDEFIISDGETPLSANGWFADHTLIKKVYQGRNCTNIGFESKEVESLTIGDYVTEISDAMYMNTPLQEVTFGKSLTKIGSGAFKGTKLKEINLPESLSELGSAAFDDCALLENFNIPSKITELGYNFNNCPSIRKITIPSTVSSLTAVFGDCGTIDEFIISDGETPLSTNGWFAHNTLIKTVYQGRNCTNIRFESKEVEFLTIGNYVTEISDAMYINTPLQEVTFGKNLAKIGDSAFQGTKLKEINLPESLTELGNNSFLSCALLERFNIPSKITELGCNFNFCTSLSQITIPATVSLLGYGFQNCGTINELIISDGETPISSEPHFANGTSFKKVYLGRNYDGSTLYEKEIESLTVGDFVTDIADVMFMNNPLQEVTFGKKLAKIGSTAFGNCNDIKQITVYAEEVPECYHESVFSQEAYNSTKVLVPSGKRQAYAEAPVWKLFKNLGQSTCAVTFEYDERQCNLTLPDDFEGTVKNSESLSFTLQPVEGHKINEVSANGEYDSLATGENEMWNLENITSDVTVKISSEILTYAVNTKIDPDAGHITINNEAADNTRIEWGKNAVITISLNEGYKIDAIFVNGTDATDMLSGTQLTFEAITHDITVEVEASLIQYRFITEYDNTHGTVTVNGNTSTEQSYAFGSRPEIEIVPDEGYCISWALLNETDIKDILTANKYVLDPIKSDITLSVGFEARLVTLAILGIEGGRVGGIYDYGVRARVKIMPDDGWKVNTIAFNGNPIEETELNNGVFLTPALTDDSEMSVTFEKDDASVNGIADEAFIRVYGYKHKIRIMNAPENEKAYITDINGCNIYSGTDREIDINASGVYIVVIANKTFKLML